MSKSVLIPEYRQGNLVLPRLGLWMDPHESQTGSDLVFVSHAHSDHVAPHREVVLSSATALLMQMRVPGQRKEIVLPFGRSAELQAGEVPFKITLLPAGHILGSAMALVEAEGESLLYTGDFKLRPGLSAEPCEPRAADYLIMETTFGRQHYVFPPTSDVLRGIVRFCRETLENDQTAVLLGYSLGKSQEILCALGEAGLPIMLHGAIYKPTQIYQNFGTCFPPFEPYKAGAARGKVLLCPPSVVNSAMLRGVGPVRSAILTGWAVDPNCRYRYQCDAAFPLSDHADFPDLLELVRKVNPRKVYTLHGFAADFAQTLREKGYKAQALSESEQFSFGLEMSERPPEAPSTMDLELHDAPLETPGDPKKAFERFTRACEQICSTSSKLEKTRILADYLKSVDLEEVRLAATWFTGRAFPPSGTRPMQLGWAVLRDALSGATGVSATDFHHVYLKYSDLGETAFDLLSAHPAGNGLAIMDVARLFEQLRDAKGPSMKGPLLAGALRKCTPCEAKYLVKIITGDLRIGLKEGLVEDAVAAAFECPSEDVRQANLLVGDIGETAVLAAQKRLQEAALVPFRPFKFMLASPEETAALVWERMRPGSNEGPVREETPATVWIEDKYDGIRCQLHKVGQNVALYSRDQKEITSTFRELAEALRVHKDDFVLDGEIVAMRGETILPFAELQRRLGRREPDLFMREEVPVRMVAFDLLWHNGTTLLSQPLSIRRGRLEEVTAGTNAIASARVAEARSAADIDAEFERARQRGNEGLMIKDPQSVYAPGRRGLAWLKLKKALATLDCVVVGAEYGHGKRSKVLSDYTFAVREEQTGELKVIGKAYTGLTDVEIQQLTEHFLRTAVRQHGRFFEVRPEIVLEIAFDRLQPSSRHGSGLAMRFPRIVRIRTDKPLNEIDTLETARKIAGL